MITQQDSIFVTVFHLGLRLLCVKMSGLCSMADLMQKVSNQLGAQYRGKLLTLETRNASQGWTRRTPLLFAA